MSVDVTLQDYLIHYLTQESFRRAVRNQTRGLLGGHFNEETFTYGMLAAMDRGYNQAWKEGESTWGIRPDERTDEERDELNRYIFEQASHLPGFASAIQIAREKIATDEDLTLKEKAKIRKRILARADMWASRYNEVIAIARTMAGANKKLKWNLGPTCEHCPSCLKLADKVKRGKVWRAADIRPKHPNLKCGGYKCKCSLDPTDLPLSRGPLPRIP